MGAGKARRQTNHRKGTMARRALVDMEGNTGANTREKSCEKPPAGHRHGGGLDEETTNTRDGRWPHLQPREGGECLAEKQSRTNATHKRINDDTQARSSPCTTIRANRVPWSPPGSGLRRASALNNDGKATVLRLRYRRFTRSLARH